MPTDQQWKICYYTATESPKHIVTQIISASGPAEALATGNQSMRDHHQLNPAALAATIEPDG